jgi:hypothetical protein
MKNILHGLGSEVEWHIGGGEGAPETIVWTGRRLGQRLSRLPRWVWRVALAAILVLACATLTVYLRYRRAEERLAFQLQSVIDLQGRTFVQGDFDLYLAQQDEGAAEWYELQSLLIWAAQEWPGGSGALPFVARPAEVRRVELHGDVAWVEVVQGDPAVRAMRFYRRSGPDWLQTEPDRAFWGDEIRFESENGLTVHCHEQDRPYAEPLAQVLEQDLAQICVTLGCPNEVTLVIATLESETFRADIGVPSPWLSGIPVDGSPWLASNSTMLYPGESVRQAVLHAVVDRAASERFLDETLWQETPLADILPDYVAWVVYRDPKRAPLVGQIVARHGEKALPAMFEALARGPSRPEFCPSGSILPPKRH